MGAVDLEALAPLVAEAKRVARQYHALTGRPLGITGEVAEYEAARLLRLDLCPARQPGYDAIRRHERGEVLVQIKGRCVLDHKRTQRVGRIDLEKPWDVVVLVLLNADFEPYAIYEAERLPIERAIKKPGSEARKRGALSVPEFKSIAHLVWAETKVAPGSTPKGDVGQDAVSGSRANAFGRQMAQLVSRRLGLELLEGNSNKFRGPAGMGVIKSAKMGNGRIGVTKTMLAGLDLVVVALEEQSGTFQIYELSRASVDSCKRESGSTTGKRQWFLDARDIRRFGTLLDAIQAGNDFEDDVVSARPIGR